jgi:hypothetical protein
MDENEMANLFDVTYNNITSNQAPGLSDYEVSLFLTKAQNELLKNYFNPKGNKYGEGFDYSPKRHIDFSNVIMVKKYRYSDIEHEEQENDSFEIPVDDDLNIMMMLNEEVRVTRGNRKRVLLSVVPIAAEEYQRIITKPYKRPLKHQAWRIINHPSDHKVFLIVVGPGDILDSYTMRYVRRPRPIIISNLPDNLSIDGKRNQSSCELDDNIHEEIVQRAVELAKTAWQGDLNSTIQAGQRSE